MEEIIRFVTLAQSARFTVSELCEQVVISRKTGYEHLKRYSAAGLKGLAVRSHRPHQFPQRTDTAVAVLDSQSSSLAVTNFFGIVKLAELASQVFLGCLTALRS